MNAADYGFPQRRRRVFLVAHHVADGREPEVGEAQSHGSTEEGVLARGLAGRDTDRRLPTWTRRTSSSTAISPRSRRGSGLATNTRRSYGAGVMWEAASVDRPVEPGHAGKRRVLGDMLVSERAGPESFFIPEEQLERWQYLKGPKDIPRVAKNGQSNVLRGWDRVPGSVDQPSRTILTGEGGVTPSRFKHVIERAMAGSAG